MANRNDIRFTQEIKLAKNTFSKPGFEFAGWDIDPSAKKVLYVDEATVSELGDANDTVVLYPVWKEKSYKIEYVENGIVVATDTLLYTEKKRLKTNQMASGDYVDNGYEYASNSEVVNL